jgi:predicted transcriptional regulator
MKPTITDVKTVRKAVGMKQYFLAELLRIEQSNYANMENGKLITSRLQEVVESALVILIPMLEEDIRNNSTKNAELKKLLKTVKNY